MEIEKLLQKIENLEQKYAFQEQHLEELNKQLVIVNKKNIEQEIKIKKIAEFLRQNCQKEENFTDGRPPHY